MVPPPADNRKEFRNKGLVTACHNWLEVFEAIGPKRFSGVVTDDECWISFFIMKGKRSNMVWLAEDEPRPEVLRTGFR